MSINHNIISLDFRGLATGGGDAWGMCNLSLYQLQKYHTEDICRLRQWRTGRDAKLRSQPGPSQVYNNRALRNQIRGYQSVVFQDIYAQEITNQRNEGGIVRKKTIQHCLGYIIRFC